MTFVNQEGFFLRSAGRINHMYTVCFKKSLSEFGISQVAVERSEAGGRSWEQLGGIQLGSSAVGQAIPEQLQKEGETCRNTGGQGCI